eukprot:1158144-Pelagomonas_calceolata.AAC.4
MPCLTPLAVAGCPQERHTGSTPTLRRGFVSTNAELPALPRTSRSSWVNTGETHRYNPNSQKSFCEHQLGSFLLWLAPLAVAGWTQERQDLGGGAGCAAARAVSGMLRSLQAQPAYLGPFGLQ